MNHSHKLIPQNQQLTTVASAGSSILSSKMNKFSAASHLCTTPARTMSGMVDHATLWKAERVSKYHSAKQQLLHSQQHFIQFSFDSHCLYLDFLDQRKYLYHP